MLARRIKCVAIVAFLVVGNANVAADPIDYKELCKTKLCVPKCCPENQFTYRFHKRCFKRKAKRDFSEVPLYYDNDLTKSGRFLNDVVLVPGRLSDPDFNNTASDKLIEEIRHNYYITEKGMLHEEVPNTFNRWTIYNNSQFCVDYTLPMPQFGINNITLRFYLTMPNVDSHSQPMSNNGNLADTIFYIYGLLISCFFLILLLVVYALLRELRNLTGKVLMAFVASLLFNFLLMFTIQIKQHKDDVCKWLTYFIHFFCLSGFCWMNIMSCDIWWTFRGYAKARPIHRRGENFKFCMYCCYAWGLPAALTSTMIVLNETNMRHMPWFVTPNIPISGCFFGKHEKLFYLYIPMLILIICNWIFFLMTAFNIWRLHRATAVLDSAAAGTPAAHRSQKYRLIVYLKLSVIMGISWVLEVVRSFIPDFKGWYISDIYNILIGLNIFFIFVCKKKILRKLTKRFSGFNKWPAQPWHSRSRSSNATESDVSAEAPVCINPKGPVKR